MAAIGYRIVDCALGSLLVAGTVRGVCNIRFGDTPERLLAELQAEFPFAALEPGGEQLGAWTETLLRYLCGKSRDLGLPLDVRGSQFQRRVWDAISAIPYGATCSYGDLAARIGRPRAARAVARACGANPVPLLVPCHRVVGGRGGLGGYRYGVERKRALLAVEAQSPATATPNSEPPPAAETMEIRALRPLLAAITPQWVEVADSDSSAQPAPGSSAVKNSKTASGSLSTSKTTNEPGPSAAIQRVGRASG